MVPRKKVRLSKRSDQDRYNDQTLTLRGVKFIAERYY